jgi:general secretion pathway protein G
MNSLRAVHYCDSCRRAHWCRPSTCGFTLIELLIVFVLIALLLTLAVPRYLNTTQIAKEKVRAQNMATLRDALDKFKSDTGRYPNAFAELVQKQYLRQLPEDPVTGSTRWVPIATPAGLEPGIYDVGPPSAVVEEPESTRAGDTTAAPAPGAGSKP